MLTLDAINALLEQAKADYAVAEQASLDAFDKASDLWDLFEEAENDNSISDAEYAEREANYNSAREQSERATWRYECLKKIVGYLTTSASVFEEIDY